jgi:hypothetical protein
MLRNLAEEIRAHKLLAVRAVLIGWTVALFLWWSLALRLAQLDELLFFAGWGDYRWFWKSGSGPVSHFLIGGLLNFTAGWIVGLLHRERKAAMVTAFFVSFAVVADGARIMDVLQNADKGNLWRGLGICLLDFLFMKVPVLGGIYFVPRAVAERVVAESPHEPV